MAVTSAPSPLDEAIVRYESLLADLSKGGNDSKQISRNLLFARDHVEDLLRSSGTLDPAVFAQMSALDHKLRHCRNLLHFNAELENIRSLLNPPKRRWWWYPPPPNPAWTVAALFVLTVSIAILADFTRRLLNSGPDGFGFVSIAVQAVFTVGATSTFTSAGREAMNRFLARLGVASRYQPAMKLGATLALFAVVFFAWKCLPNFLADHYNDVAFRTESSDPEAARSYYGKAISLNPSSMLAHFNLGALYENDYEYDKAAAEYRRVIVIQPNHMKAYSNLARLLLMENDPTGSLQVGDDALKLPVTDDPELTAALYRTRALAEYQIGLYHQAEADAKHSAEAQSSAADAYCVLGKIYSKQGRATDARKAWENFLSRVNNHVPQPRPEPDCIHLASEVSYENH